MSYVYLLIEATSATHSTQHQIHKKNILDIFSRILQLLLSWFPQPTGFFNGNMENISSLVKTDPRRQKSPTDLLLSFFRAGNYILLTSILLDCLTDQNHYYYYDHHKMAAMVLWKDVIFPRKK